MHWLMVALGGALGAVLRFAVTRWEQQWFLAASWPVATFTVNVLGSLGIGVCYVVIVEQAALPEEWRYPLMAGFLGALTTFSTFALEAVTLLEGGRPMAAAGYVLASVLLCLFGCILGMWLARLLLA